MTVERVVLTGADLTISHVAAVARGGAEAVLDPAARARMERSRAVVEALVDEGAVVYGVTTGVGALANRSIDRADAERLQQNLLVTHAAGVGEPLPREIVRAMLLLRANTLALGFSGARPIVAERLLDFLRLGVHPVVPAQGSVGASGDLAPLAHLALPLMGRGQVELDGHVVTALIALRETGLEPLVLGAKEGLAILNGTQLMTALGALVAVDAARLNATASVVAAMSVEALLGTDVAFSAALQAARPHPGQVAVAAELRWLLRDSGLQRTHHASAHKVQDAYSLRCVPQVHGAARDALGYLGGVLAVEMNAATDNPLIFPDGGVSDVSARATGGGRVISGGNFHGEPIALALDFAKLALAELGSISERRTALLLDPNLNGGLPAFLGSELGLETGLMLLQYTAAALASENKGLAHPASADSIPTSANQEDHVSMGPIAGRQARLVVEHVERILAIELVCAARALDLRLALVPDTAPGAGVIAAHAEIRDVVPPWAGDREPGPDLEAATRLVREGRLASLVAPEIREMSEIRIVDVTDAVGFARIPACVDPGFDHRTCDYWEDDRRGSKAARRSWLQPTPAPAPEPARAANPFAPPDRGPTFNPFDPRAGRPAAGNIFDPFDDGDDEPPANPFAPPRERGPSLPSDAPRKLQLLTRGKSVFGSYAKVLEADGEPVAYCQFGPLSAYPRAQTLRDLYPKLPSAPLPAVITCIATTAPARGLGLAQTLVLAVVDDLAGRGFSAVEAYPEPDSRPDATSAAYPAFWQACGFELAIDDPRFPVMRREL